MSPKIKISAGNIIAEAELNDSPTARDIWQGLPLEGSGNTWGDEIYFEIPVSASLDDTARELVSIGDLGYWPNGSAFCIFFGPTPISEGEEIRPYSAVNIIGKVLGNPKVFKKVPPGTKIKLESLS
jgi:uncharacterized protein